MMDEGKVTFIGGNIDGEEIRIPYCITAISVEGNTIRADLAVSADGDFASSDAGRTWGIEPISIQASHYPMVCRTEKFYYYFALAGPAGSPTELWYSRQSIGSLSWNQPETLNKTGAHNLKDTNLRVVANDETVHVCWLDGRHEKTSFSWTRPMDGNYEVLYRFRQDSDSRWSKETILSKGLRFAFSPSMSVDGNKLVIAWAGAKGGGGGRTEYGPSDIYYVTSKDNGASWTKPQQVTHGFKTGITSGRPQVALHNGVIHLFYVQGKLNFKKVSAGMVKLNQPPWPIYYQQRPFPK